MQADSNNFNHVVLYNPGQYVTDQEKFFIQRTDAEKWARDYGKAHPMARVRIFTRGEYERG